MTTDDHPYRDCLCLASRRLSRVLTQLYDGALDGTGLKVTQFSILTALALDRAQGLPLSPVAAALDMDLSTLSRNLRPLIRDGLVVLEAGEDRRERKAKLTAAGRHKLDQALPRWRTTQKRARAALGPGAGDALGRLLAGAHQL